MRKGFGFHDRHSPFRFDPATLFIGGAVKGAFYDPSNITTLFQDDAGTTPVTAVEQTVGRILDLSGNANHATQSVLASRPTYRARYNLLTYSEQFNDAAWTKNNATITANATTAPDGTMTADKMIPSTSNTQQQVIQTVTVVAGVYTQSVYAKADGYSFLQFNNSQNTNIANFDVSNGTVGTTSGSVTATITALANGWYRCAVTYSAFTAGSIFFRVQIVGSSTASRAQAFQGDGTSGIFIWGAQLLPANDVAITGNAYQRVAAATSYDTSSPVWRPYLAFDGSDDSMLTSSIDFTGTDKMTVWAGVTKLSDAAPGDLVELSAITGSNPGSFTIFAPGNWTGGTAGKYFAGLNGNTGLFADLTNYPAPISNVLAISYDIGGAAAAQEIVPRINGVTPTISYDAANAGTGNFGNYPLYIGRRNNATLPFNGRLYGLIVLGAAASDWQVYVTEQWMAGKTGLQF